MHHKPLTAPIRTRCKTAGRWRPVIHNNDCKGGNLV